MPETTTFFSNLFRKFRFLLYDYPIYNRSIISNKIEYALKSTITTSQYRFASMGFPLTANERNILHVKNKHKAQRCFIIGNGPSLNKIDLTKLQNEITFGVNAIYTNYPKMGFYPTYYVVEDLLVAEDRAREINTYKNSYKFFGNFLSYCLNKDNKSTLLNVVMNYDDYFDFPRFSKNALRRVWAGGTVTYLCLQLAYYMGFKEVYLIGFDHSYSIPKEALVGGDRITSTSEDPNHFSPEYFGKGKRWHDPKVDRMELAYKKAKKYFEADNRRIYNATDGGHLEVFDRVDYDRLFE